MCAECHSTNLKKGYEIEKNRFNTTWSEIDVSCEACRGPGSDHVDWALTQEMGRPGAASGLPGRPRIHYNLGLSLQFLKKSNAAEKSLLRALSLEPGNFDFLFALADHYIKRDQFDHALLLAQKMIQLFPGNKTGVDILKYARAMKQKNNRASNGGCQSHHQADHLLDQKNKQKRGSRAQSPRLIPVWTLSFQEPRL